MVATILVVRTAVIERKVLIVSSFANARDYSNKTCTYRSMCMSLQNMQVLLEWSLVLAKNDTMSSFLSITAILFWPSKWRPSNGSVQKCLECDVTCNGSLCISK